MIGRRLGDFTILGELGRGGMGVVYSAKQESISRIVALKTLPSFIAMDNDAVARFRREAEAAGRLSHPGIVPIYAVGEVEGIHYYAMELVDGPSIAGILDQLADRSPDRLLGTLAEETIPDQPPPWHESVNVSSAGGSRYSYSCAAIVADLASALAAAHRGMVIHRDIKPSNVLVRQTGKPVLVDFGLARDEMTVGLTRSGDALGTPAYMAPEQARGAKDLDARVDIYGLGALLYEMLTLRPPFDGAHPAEIMRKIVENDPVSVRSLNNRVPADLEKIVHTCLAKNPEDRYAAAEALEMDLRAFIDGRPVIARRPKLRDRITRILRRDRRAVIAAAMVLVASVVGFATFGIVRDQHNAAEAGRMLKAALRHLQVADVPQAIEAYGRAEAYLDRATVVAARRDHLRQAFEPLYQAGEHERLRRYLDSWTAVERDAQWARCVARLDGRGTLDVRAQPASEVEIRRALDSNADWKVWNAGAQLELGEYLVRVRRADAMTVVQRATVERDHETVVRPFLAQREDVPADMLLVADPLDPIASVVQRTELSWERYRDLVKEIADVTLRAELAPPTDADWYAGDTPDRPARGLTFAQARTLAALTGHHLLDRREYELAVTAGVESMDFPWGAAFDQQRVAADQHLLNRPESVGSVVDGASPLGILDLVGNVHELLSPPLDSWVPVAAGGHYQSEPSDLTWRARGEPQLSGLHDSNRFTGFRLARFATPRPDPAIEAEVQARVDALLKSGQTGLLNDWVIRADGSARVEFEMVGRHLSTGSARTLELVTEGFAQIGETAARDGFGKPMNAARTRDPQRPSRSEVSLYFDPPAQRGQQYRLGFGVDLQPRSALVGRADVYTLRVPLKTVGSLRSMVRVQLPPRCRVESVQPRPTAVHYDEEGCARVVWLFDTVIGGALTVPAVVRFRRDGTLTGHWPAEAEVRGAVEGFVSALRAGDREALDRMLTPEFTQLPQVRGRKEVIEVYSGTAARREQIGDYEFRDAIAVGPIVTAWIEVDWTVRTRDGGEITLKRWPLRVQMRRRPDGQTYEFLELALAGRSDEGEIIDGVYRHPQLMVEVRQPEGLPMRMVRADGHLTPMQLVCLPVGESAGGISFSLYGVDQQTNETRDQILHRLTDGGWSMRAGDEAIADTSKGVLGDAELADKTLTKHWMFARADGSGYDREAWTILQLGQRWILARARAFGRTTDEANQRYRQHRRFFDSVGRRVEIRRSQYERK